jgi:2-polyprenyl-6-methoxyphenol hydroxylase-like FAD-dependent oxidoreductase
MRVVIVGAGLSGLSLAGFLRRVGIDCVILEQAPYMHANFQLPIVLYANALSCIKAFDMGGIFDDGSIIIEKEYGIKNPTGRWLLKFKNHDISLSPLGKDDRVPISTALKANAGNIVNQRLQEVQKYELGIVPLRSTFSARQLKNALRRFAPDVHFGSRVVDIVPHDGVKGGAFAVMDNGTKCWGDVIVGADGMHSTVRKLLYPNQYVGTTSASLNMTQVDGFVELPELPSYMEACPHEVWGHRKTIALYPMFHQGEKRVAFSATLYEAPEQLERLDSSVSDEEYRQVYRNLLKQQFAEFGDEVTNVLRAATVAVPTEVIEVPIMPQWFHKRAVLIGEAAHGAIPSFLSQDSSLCVEDAALLATSLLDLPSSSDASYEYVFKNFETIRRTRIEKYIRQSRTARAVASTKHSTLRNMAISKTPARLLLSYQKWLSRWHFSSQHISKDSEIIFAHLMKK